MSCTWAFSALPEPTTACLIWRVAYSNTSALASTVPQMAAPRACPSFRALSGLRLTNTRSMAISCGRYCATMLRTQRKISHRRAAEFALRRCGSRRSPRRSAAARRHPRRRSRCAASPDRCRAPRMLAASRRAQLDSSLGLAWPAYDTGNRRLNPPTRRVWNRWKPPRQPGPRARGSTRASRPCARSSCPPAAEPCARRGARSGRDRAHARCRRRRGDRRDAAAAARGAASRSRCRAAKRFGAEPPRLARALSQLGQFGLPPDWTPGARPRSGAGRGAAQDAARGHRRCAPGRGAARRTAAEDALRQVRSTPRGSASSRSRPARSMRRSPIASASGR